MRMIHGLLIVLTLALVMAACGSAPAADDATPAPVTAGDRDGGGQADQPDGGGAATGDKPEPAPISDEPNEIVEGKASGKLQGSWKADPTPAQLASFAETKGNPEKATEKGETPPDPAAIASSTMVVSAQEITMSMGENEMVNRYAIVEDGDNSIIYEVQLEAPPGAPEGTNAPRGRFKVTFETDDRMLVAPHEMDGFEMTFVRAS